MPLVSCRRHALHQDPKRAVFASLEFVADDDHLFFQVLCFNPGVDQTVSFHLDRKIQIIFFGWQRFVIVCSVVPSRSIHVQHAAILEELWSVGKQVGPAKQHMLQQVRHARFAVTFMTGANKDGHVDGELRLRSVGEQEDLDAVVELVFGNTFDFGNFLGLLGRDVSRSQPAEQSQADRQHGEFFEDHDNFLDWN